MLLSIGLKSKRAASGLLVILALRRICFVLKCHLFIA